MRPPPRVRAPDLAAKVALLRQPQTCPDASECFRLQRVVEIGAHEVAAEDEGEALLGQFGTDVL